MAQRSQKKDSAPAEILSNMSMGYNGFTDPNITKPEMWAQATNVFSGQAGFIQRCRFANVVGPLTNFFSFPTQFDNAVWAVSATVTANTDIAPDGTLTADRITDGSAVAFLAVGQSVSVPADFRTYTVSIYVKKTVGATNTFAINLQSSQPRLNTNTGVFSSGFNTAVADAGTFWRLSCSFVNTGLSSLGVNFFPASGTNSGSNPGGDDPAATGSAVVWGAQFEVGSVATNFMNSTASGLPFSSLKYFALPGLSAYLLADINGKLYSYDTGSAYTQTQRINSYVDPAGTGSSSLNGPWSREVLQNIVYEMNGTVKQAGRLANGATIEGFGLDAPDASPQVVITSAPAPAAISSITRLNGTVTATVASTAGLFVGEMINIAGVTDTSFNGTFVLVTIPDGTHFTYTQFGQNVTSSGGTWSTQITKSTGRSYAWAWENSNKPHVSAPSPSTQFIQYNAQNSLIQLIEPGTVTTNGTTTVTGTQTFFTAAWIGRSLWVASLGSVGRIVAVPSSTSLTLATAAAAASGKVFQVFDPQATHVRLYETADGGATYFRTQRNTWNPNGTNITFGDPASSGLVFSDVGNSEPPSFPFTTETSQLFNLPPPIGQFINEYQGRLLVYGVAGALQSFFYSNQESTNIGMPQESFAPLNQVTLPIANGKLNGMIEFPGSLVMWSDKQDMFRLTGLLTDNTAQTAAQQGASISRLPYNLGIANPFAVDISPLGAIWVTPNAEIWLFTDRYAPRNIGKPVQDILNSVTKAMLLQSRVKYYHTNNRNWIAVSLAANGSTFNNTVLILDLDLLASNGSPSYFTFDMATNHPAWWVFNPGPLNVDGTIHPRCDFLETVYESGGVVRLLASSVDLIQDIDYQTAAVTGVEIAVPNAGLTPHAWGNDHAFVIKRPSFIRFNTNQDPSLLASQGWVFGVQGIDDDFYTFLNPLALTLTPGINDTSTLCGNPNLVSGESFRHSPCLFRIGGVNFVAGRRLRFPITFPSIVGGNYQLSSIQIGFGPSPPR